MHKFDRNASYVKDRHQVFQLTSNLQNDLFDVILKMNLFCVTLHEFSHARLCQVYFSSIIVIAKQRYTVLVALGILS